MKNIFSTILNPQSLAIVGASRSPQKIGHQILNNLRIDGYTGNLYPVNPNAKNILNFRAYPSLSHLPHVPDCVIIVTPAQIVPSILIEAGHLGIKSAIVITSGFAESGIQGIQLQSQLKAIIQQSRIRILGPNCLGVLNPSVHLNATFGPRLPQKGSIMLISQSGALVTGILDWLRLHNLGLSSAVTLGNRLDVNENEALLYAAADPNTKCILVYVESFYDAHTFFAEASRISPKKPIILLKGGTTPAGQTASASHTAALASNQILIDAFAAQTGVIEAHDYESWLKIATFVTKSPEFFGTRITIVTNAGGPGVLTADALSQSGLELSKIPSGTNPIDILGDATPDDYAKALITISQNTTTDGLVIMMTPQTNTHPQAAAQSIIKSLTHFNKPKVAVLVGGEKMAVAKREFAKVNFPVFDYPNDAVTVMSAKALYDTRKKKTPLYPQTSLKTHHHPIKISGLSIADLFDRLEQSGFNLPKYQVVNSIDGIPEAMRFVGQPAVLKTAGLRIPHKAKVGGVMLDIMTNSQARIAFRRLKTLFPEVLFQQTVNGHLELIIGAKRDSQLGPFVTCGLGGTLTNTLADRAYAFIPTTTDYLLQAFVTTKAYQACLNLKLPIKPIINAMQLFSELLLQNPHIEEMEINPAILTTKTLFVADFKVTYQ